MENQNLSQPERWTKNQGIAILAIPAQDKVYQSLFPNLKEIHREKTTYGRSTELDEISHIDVTITLANSKKITTQEKAIAPRYIQYETLTIEAWQNFQTREPGELYTCKADYYLHGYLLEDYSNARWAIYDMAALRRIILGTWMTPCNVKPNGDSKAGFLALSYSLVAGALLESFGIDTCPGDYQQKGECLTAIEKAKWQDCIN